MRFSSRLIPWTAVLLASFLLQRPARPNELLAVRGATIETVSGEGRIENGTLLIRDGKIEAIGSEVKIPIAAKIIEAHGKVVIPGLIDPYFTVSIGRNAQASDTRTIVVSGRTFNIGGSSPAASTAFARVASGIHLDDIDWQPAIRSGITTAQLAAAGYCQSALANLGSKTPKIFQPEGEILVSVTNDSRSLDVIRNGLREPRSGAPRGGAAGEAASSSGGRSGPANPEMAADRASDATPAAPGGRADLWKPIREGERTLFLNVNNAAAILHALAATKDNSNVKVTFVASAADIYRVIDQLDAARHSVVLAPRVETIPNSQNLVNVPKLLADAKIPFVFSTSLGQSEFRAQQDAPLFSVGLLVRFGLPREKALEGLTIGPARMLGLGEEIGSLEVGKKGNFVILDSEPFGVSTGISSVYVEGKPIYEGQ
jgi:imidazolonepropionase-like amidohydrolase